MSTSHLRYSDRAGFNIGELGQFEISHQIRPEALCLRVLCGTCSVYNVEADVTTIVKTNFLESPFSENVLVDMSFLDSYQEGINSGDYNQYLSGSAGENRGFYSEFLSEVTIAACAAEQDQGTISFLHIYRAYERISYAFPLIYAAKSRDYLGSFGKLKEWLADKKTDGTAGELSFLKYFIEATYDEDERLATSDFQFIGSDLVRSRQFSLVRNALLKWNPNFSTAQTVENEVISVPFGQLHTLLLNARNRYFHQMSGRSDNIRQSAIIDSEIFFRVLCRPLLSYVAKLFHDLLIHDMRTQ